MLTQPEDRLYRKVIYRIVPLFFLGYVISYLDRVNIGFAKLQMASEFGLSDASFAVGASVFFWGYMLFELPSNLLMHRIGARVWIARIMITWGIVSMLMIFSYNTAIFYSLRFLLGICEAGFVPGVMLYVNNWLPTQRQGGMYSLFLMALPISLVIGAPLSGFILVALNGALGVSGWQWLFLVEGVPAIALGLVIFFLLDNRIADARWLSAEEKALLQANVTSEARHKLTGIVAMLRSKYIYLLMLAMILFNSGFYGLSFWLPTILKATGVTGNFTVGLLTAIPFVGAAIAMRLNALHSERTREKRLHGTLPALVASLSLAVATYFSHDLLLSLIMLTLAASGILSLMPIFWSLPGRFLSGTAAAAGLALINSMGSVSGIVGASVVGYGGAQTGMYILAGFLLAFAALFYLMAGSILNRYDATDTHRQASFQALPQDLLP